MAVKCLAKDKLKTQMADFLLEAANMCSVDHKHIVQLYGVVLSSDSLMLVIAFAFCRLNFVCLVCGIRLLMQTVLSIFTARRYASMVYVVIVCLSMCLCMCLCHMPVLYQNSIMWVILCFAVLKHRITHIMPQDSPDIIVFWCQKS